VVKELAVRANRLQHRSNSGFMKWFSISEILRSIHWLQSPVTSGQRARSGADSRRIWAVMIMIMGIANPFIGRVSG